MRILQELQREAADPRRYRIFRTGDVCRYGIFSTFDVGVAWRTAAWRRRSRGQGGQGVIATRVPVFPRVRVNHGLRCPRFATVRRHAVTARCPTVFLSSRDQCPHTHAVDRGCATWCDAAGRRPWSRTAPCAAPLALPSALLSGAAALAITAESSPRVKQQLSCSSGRRCRGCCSRGLGYPHSEGLLFRV